MSTHAYTAIFYCIHEKAVTAWEPKMVVLVTDFRQHPLLCTIAMDAALVLCFCVRVSACVLYVCVCVSSRVRK